MPAIHVKHQVLANFVLWPDYEMDLYPTVYTSLQPHFPLMCVRQFHFKNENIAITSRKNIYTVHSTLPLVHIVGSRSKYVICLCPFAMFFSLIGHISISFWVYNIDWHHINRLEIFLW